MTKKVTLDYETRSEADLKSVGPYLYANHPSTEVLCVSWAVEDDEPLIWFPDYPELSTSSYEKFRRDIMYNDTEAHNALFEILITNFTLRRKFKDIQIVPANISCTAARAASIAIPRHLEGAAQVMGLKSQKDMVGNRLMKKYMKPRQAWKKWALEGRIGDEPKKWHDDFLELERIGDYCIRDVVTERELSKVVPELTPEERLVWLSNIRMNMRGISVDVDAAKLIVKLYKKEIGNLERELNEITGGKVTSVSQVAKLLEWLSLDMGVAIDNLRASTVKEVLEDESVTGNARRVLEIRAQASKSSIKKYPAIINRAASDGRVRDLSLYHGASTGRESGTGLQIQNLPRGTIKVSSEYAIDVIKESRDLEEIRFLCGQPIEVFSSCVRGMIKATEGYHIVAADLNAIEARIVNWLFGNHQMVNAFARGDDVYKLMASMIYKIDVDQVTDFQRFVGKTTTLGCGYGMGPPKFLTQLHNFGVKDADLELAKLAVKAYRDNNQAVTRGWTTLERAAIEAVGRPGAKVSVFKVSWKYDGKILWCQLPSGRRLAYFSPEVVKTKTPWGDPALKLYYWGVDEKKKWSRMGTYGGHLTENLCQAIARDITVNGIRNAERCGFDYMFQVHDEIVCESKALGVDDLVNALTSKPSWAKDLPVAASGWIGPRYKK